jgi:uncharacterized lipoprotein YajG
MNSKLNLVFIFLFTIFLAGCAYTPHKTNLLINAPVSSTDIGSGTKISIRVIDDRDSQIIGKRGVGNLGANITASDLMPIITSAIDNGFKSKKFEIVSKDNSDVHLVVKLRAFKYLISQGFFTGGEDISVVINANSRNGSKEFEQTYRYSNEERKVFIPDGSGLNDDLNAALNSTLTQLLNDKELDNFLIQ